MLGLFEKREAVIAKKYGIFHASSAYRSYIQNQFTASGPNSESTLHQNKPVCQPHLPFPFGLPPTNPCSKQLCSMPAPCLLSEEFQALVDQNPFIIDNYTILNKMNNPMQRKTSLETRQVQFFVNTTYREEYGHLVGSLSFSVLCRPETQQATECLAS